MDREGAAMSDLSEDPALVAQERSLVLVLPGARDVFIDIDDDASLAIFDAMMGVLASNGGVFPLREVKRTKSEHGNTHVYLEASRDLSDVERIALQACLGSDRKRELLSMLRLEVESPFPASTSFEVPVPDPLGADPGTSPARDTETER